MFHRSALFFGFASIVALAIGCSATPGDVAKDGKPFTGSPNDPGWVPPGANPGPGQDDSPPQTGDDQGEQPSCTPRDTATPPNWTDRVTTDFSVATPTAWFDFGSTENELRYVEGLAKGSNGMTASLTAYATLGADISAYEVGLTMHGQRRCVFAVKNVTFRCDPGMELEATCRDAFPVHVLIRAVMHDGKVYDVDCGGEGDTSFCSTMLDSLRFAK